jgi:glycosyltransferase involved in cell wall biosynthesis
VVATGRGGSGEYLEHEANALLFEAGDATALAAALRRLASDPGLRERLRASGLATARRISEPAWAACVVREHEQLGR